MTDANDVTAVSAGPLSGPARGRRWWTPTEVAAELDVSAETVRAWCRSGRLPAVKAGKQFRIPAAALDAFLVRYVDEKGVPLDR